MLGRLAFIGVAQSAGFKLTEIKDLGGGVDGTDGMASQMRALSSRKLEEVTALLERTRAIKGWLEVAHGCGCQTPDMCALFPSADEESVDAERAQTILHVQGKDCRRAREPAWFARLFPAFRTSSPRSTRVGQPKRSTMRAA